MADNPVPAWQTVPGNPALRWLVLLTEPSLERCNTYLIDAGSVTLIIDPGSGGPQLEAALAGLPPAQPLLAIYTHCHVDHTGFQKFSSGRHAERLTTMLHAAGAAALAAGDAQLTQAELFDHPQEPRTTDAVLFRPDDAPGGVRTLTLRGGGALSVRTAAEPPWPTPVQDLATAHGVIARCYHAPGHSPDGIHIQSGTLLFAGDLLLAANPVISGIAGHDRPAYLATVDATRRLFNTGTVTVLAPGHGQLLPAIKAARRLDRLSGLARVNDPIPFSAARRDYLLATGLALAGELQELLTIIGGRLLVAAATLRELDEPGLAEWLDREFPAGQLDLAFADFARAADNFRAGEQLAIVTLHRLAHLMHQLGAGFGAGPLERVLDPVLVTRARRLLADFLLVSHGHELQRERAVRDLAPLLTQVFAPDPGLDALMATVDDQALFSAELARRLVANPGLYPPAAIILPPGLPPVAIDQARLLDALHALRRELPPAAVLTVSAAATATEVVITCAWSGAPPLNAAGDRLTRQFAAAGAAFTAAPGQPAATITCPVAD